MTKRFDQLTAHPKSTTSPLTGSAVVPIRDAALASDNTRRVTLKDITGYTANILDYGADPTEAVDSTTAIQAALDAVRDTSPAGGVVWCPAGTYKISQLQMHEGITLQGAGAGPGTKCTMFRQIDGVNTSAIVADAAMISGLYAHGVALRDFAIRKVTSATDTLGHGIFFNCHTGEAFEIARVNVTSMPQDGIRLVGATPCFLRELNLFSNGTSGTGFGLNITRGGSQSWVASYVHGISGDANHSSLVNVANCTVYFNGVKGEVFTNQTDLFTFSSTTSTNLLHIVNCSLSGTGANSFVKLTGAGQIWITQWSLQNGGTAPSYIIQDTVRAKTVNYSAAYGSVYYSSAAGNALGGEIFRLGNVGCKMSIGYDPDALAGTTGIGITTGVGDGASTGITALAKGTGSGPASLAVNKWIRVTNGTTSGWIPFFT